MGRHSSVSTVLFTNVLLLLSACSAFATAPQPTLAAEKNANLLGERSNCLAGETPCGWHGKYCCLAGQRCWTDEADIARCGGFGTATGHWEEMTTTYTEIDKNTYTSVYSTFIVPTNIPCNAADGERQCGSSCCTRDEYCALGNICKPVSPGGTTRKGNAHATPTATLPFSPPVATGANVTVTSSEESSGGGTSLSAGAIAGIVIGVIFGLILLILLCLFLCFKAAFDGLLALFGIGGRRRRVHETEYIEEHHHTSGSGYAAGAAAAGGTRRWWRSDRPSRPPPPKKSGGLGGLGGVAAGLGGLAIALGLKRRHDRRTEKSSQSGTGSSYYYYSSDYTSSSSASSDQQYSRNTRNTRRSGRH